MQRSINPFNLREICAFPLMNARDVEARLVKSRLTWETWKSTPFDIRRKHMHTVAELLESNCDEYARVITTEMGKAISEARAEVRKCADGCRFFADNAEAFLSDE